MTRTSGLTFTIAMVLALAAAPVAAQTAPTAAPPPEEPSTNAMVNLIRLLVKQGTITRENGEQLLRQAEAEAGQARGALGELTPPAPGTVRVPYVPETVRKQIRDEIKGEVMKEAQAEGWAAPNQRAPEWVNGFHPNADFRFRGEYDSFSKDNADDIFDYAAINNTPGGFDFFKNINNLPYINTRENRERLRIRARVGFDFDISKDAMIGVKLATGDDNGPISTNQVLGGGLAKRNIWLDQAYLKLSPHKWVTAEFGRFPNPFLSTDLIWDRDLNFDGALLDVHPVETEQTSLALRGGAFPLDFGSDNYPTTSSTKQSYSSKWIFGGQIEASEKLGAVKVTAAAAFYDFRNIQGQLSVPCLFNGQTVSIGTNDPLECSTDATRALFPRKGNTLFFVRNIVVPAPDTLPESNRQFFGLTYKYQLLDLNAAIDFPLASIPMRLQGNYVRNLAYDRKDECRYGVGPNGIPITNVVANSGNENPCSATNAAKVDSGNQGFLVRLLAGNRNPRKWGEWNLMGEYRYLESDAVLDAYTDSDFHLGGTNAKGYTVSGTIGLMRGVNLTARWMSANEITGRPLGIDVFQLDLSGEF
jgi:hypothetical protein